MTTADTNIARAIPTTDIAGKQITLGAVVVMAERKGYDETPVLHKGAVISMDVHRNFDGDLISLNIVCQDEDGGFFEAITEIELFYDEDFLRSYTAQTDKLAVIG